MKITKQVQFGDHVLVLETGEIARQADGAVMVSMAGTMVLVTVVGRKDIVAKDFLPLTVEYTEKTYAAGKIPGGYRKREGQPSEAETLTSRLIDRPLRPLFPNHFHHEVQIIATVLSYNPEVSPDILAMIGASAALAISGIPFEGPIAGARVGYKEGIYLLNPSSTDLKESKLDLVVAGTKDAILMVESEAQELSEEVMRGAIMFGHQMMQCVIKLIEELAHAVAKPHWNWIAPEDNQALTALVDNLASEEVKEAYLLKDKQQRYERLDTVRKKVIDTIIAENEELSSDAIAGVLSALEKTLVRDRILAGEPRIDGRDLKTVRPIAIRTKYLPRAHGSAVFTRGETQAIVAVTLGCDRDAQMIESLSGQERDRFMLHYNFPPYSVGETGRTGSPKRREIGHGRLAKRSLVAVLPSVQDFPYGAIRVVSEITESNGSSSMASVCGASLALRDAGVPMKALVAGVAMGLIKEGDRFAVLTDILGDEDHLGDMDFKVAGTEQGVTALQMDIKIRGITQEIMEQALEQAHAGRLHILGIMNNAISEHKEELSEFAPRITTMKVAEDKIRTIIGKGGATIKALTESTGVSIDIDDTGVVQLFSPDKLALENAENQIKMLIADIEVGISYTGKVSKLVDFGAFINLLPGKDGLLHISQICSDRSQKVEEILKEGQEITVFVAGVDKQGRVKLEWKDKPQAAEPVAQPQPTAIVENSVENAEEKISSED
jgi:polyribonucleotide nucleotidyltransferase